MSVREYVGARYVPIFADPLEWSSDREYEPLTIVVHDGDSYTSRQYVPVGIDIKNNDYWALTGNYNAQIEQYRSETADAMNMATAADTRSKQNGASITNLTAWYTGLEKDVNTLETGLNTTNTKVSRISPDLKSANIILIGDSYLRGVGANHGWGYYLKQTINGTGTVTEYGNSGAGFVANGHTSPMSGMNFYSMLDYAKTKTADAANIDYVIIGGGWNDNGTVSADERAQVTATAKRAKALFPNAVVVIVATTNERLDLSASYLNMYISIVQGAHDAGVGCPDHSWQWLMNNSLVSSSDGIHPNETGYKILGEYIVSYLMGSNTGTYTIMGNGFTAGTLITSNTFRVLTMNGIVYMGGNFTASTWSNDTTLGVLPSHMRPARTMYFLAQFISSDNTYKDIVPVYVNTEGVMAPRTPFGGSYPTKTSTIYLPSVSYPLGIL